jgi:SAM-dependent methyltransferase
MKNYYDENFFNNQSGGSENSASIVVPEIIKLFKPGSVVDLGCGVGTWLSEFTKNNVNDILGIDGDYVKVEMLKISKDKFMPMDVQKSFSLDRKFDMAISLEVGEHLLTESSQTFVESLTKLSDVVIFSAAIPFQGGVNHINEQWQSYWSELFEKAGFVPSVPLRKILWNDSRVLVWYKQNMVVYVKKEAVANYPFLSESVHSVLDIVHPELYLRTTDPKRASLKNLNIILKGISSIFFNKKK